MRALVNAFCVPTLTILIAVSASEVFGVIQCSEVYPFGTEFGYWYQSAAHYILRLMIIAVMSTFAVFVLLFHGSRARGLALGVALTSISIVFAVYPAIL